MKTKPFIIFFVWVCFIGLAFAQSASNKLEQKLSTFHSIKAHFHQSIRGSDGAILQESSGEMAIYRPGKFRWDVQEPMQQLILTDGIDIWMYEPDLRQVIIRPFDERLSETPVMLLASPAVHVQENFSVEEIPSDVGGKRFKLIPRGEKELFEAIIITFKQDMLFSMMLISQMGQRMELVFSKVVINSITSADLAALFSFKVPSGVDVVR